MLCTTISIDFSCYKIVDSQTSLMLCQEVGVGHFTSYSATLLQVTLISMANDIASFFSTQLLGFHPKTYGVEEHFVVVVDGKGLCLYSWASAENFPGRGRVNILLISFSGCSRCNANRCSRKLP